MRVSLSHPEEAPRRLERRSLDRLDSPVVVGVGGAGRDWCHPETPEGPLSAADALAHRAERSRRG